MIKAGLNLTYLGFTLFVLFASIAVSQPPPPPAAAPGTKPTKRWEPPSLANIKPGDEYRSWEGRFSIALPKSLSGYSAITPKSAGEPVSGGNYKWNVREGYIELEFRDFHKQPFSKYSSDRKEQVLAMSMDGALKGLGGARLAEEAFTVGGVPGRKIRMKAANGRIMLGRAFLIGDRVYSMFAEVQDSVDGAEQLLDNAFSSFKILERSEIDAEVAKAIADALPSPLPQEPLAPKEKSDADDENLKGNVRTVLKENQDLSGTWQNQSRHRSSEQEFDQKGNRTKRVSYDSTGYPFEVEIYGYIDGARVSKSKTISGGTGSTLTAVGSPNAKPRDPRFGYKYFYKYSSRRLIERQLIHSDGDLWLRYEHKHSGNERTELVYSQNGKLNQKYRYVLDEKGNPIEYFWYDAFDAPDKVKRAYRYRYDAYDLQGNWTQRTSFEMISENGAETERPSSVEYRTITYYSK